MCGLFDACHSPFFLLSSFFFLLPICTLRAAIEEANAFPGEDIIILGSGTYRLSIAGIAEDKAATGDLDITDSVQIIGAGTTKTFIDADGLDRVFDILGEDTTVTLSGLTVMGGNLPAGLAVSQKGGGGIRSQGVLSLETVVVSNNTVSGATSDDVGGGVFNQGRCLLTNSTIADNHAVRGGGIMNATASSLHIIASTILGNSSQGGAGLMNYGRVDLVNSTLSNNVVQGGLSSGGAVYNQDQLQLTHCTIAENSAGRGGGLSNGGTVSMVNTLLAENKGGNCYFSEEILSEGHNLDSDNTCGLTSLDLKNIDPQLGLLQDNGGYTETYGLNPGSPAIDAGKSLQNIITDQRGLARPQRKFFDIGAFEAGDMSVVPLITPLLL